MKIESWILPALLVLGVLLFTPIGGAVKAIIFFGWLLGGAVLTIKIVGAVLQFDDFKDSVHWHHIGRLVAGLAALTALMLVATLMLPDPSGNSGSDLNWDGRSNPR